MSTTNEQSRAEIVIDTQEMTQKTIDYMRLLEYYVTLYRQVLQLLAKIIICISGLVLIKPVD